MAQPSAPPSREPLYETLRPAAPGEPSRQHLALLTDSLYGSGAERVMLNLADAFARRGHRVDFVVCRFDGHFSDEIPAGVGLVRLAAGPRFRDSLRASLGDLARAPSLIGPVLRFRKARYLAGLAAYLGAERPDGLLAANPNPNLLALWARRLAGVDTRVVLSEHNHLSAQLSRPSKRWKLALERAFYPRADGIVAVSEGVARDLAATAQIPAERITTIYNPVVSPRLVAQAQEPAQHPWLCDDGPPVVLGVGKLKHRKGFADLLRAFARLRARREARLVILGEGEERPRLEALAAELGIAGAVDLPGFVANPLACMARAAVFVLPSHWEGLPTVLIEALLCGCPVVSTDCPSGPAEILENGRYGSLVPVGDAVALADAIRASLEKPMAAGPLKARAAMFEVERSAELYLERLRG